MLPSNRKNIIAGLGLAVMSLAVLLWIIPVGIEPSGGSGGMSPEFVPRLAAMVVLTLSILLAINEWSRKTAAADEPETGNSFVYASIWAVFCIVCWIGLSTIGFIATSVGVIALWGYWTGARNLLLLAGLSIGIPIVISLGTRFIFSIYLP